MDVFKTNKLEISIKILKKFENASLVKLSKKIFSSKLGLLKIIAIVIIIIIEELIDFTDLIINDTNYKDQILRYCQHNFKVNPNYEHIRKENNTFYCNLLVNDITITGEGVTKKKAEQDASKKTLQYYNVL